MDRSGHGQLATAGEDFRIIEALAAGDEATLIFARRVGFRACLTVERPGQKVETGLLGTGFGPDNLASPSHGRATGTALLCACGGYVGVIAHKGLGNRRTSGQQSECGGEG